ncbi:helix-turn-helix transcriptional regulator, partial [Pseudomonas aeruginosa]
FPPFAHHLPQEQVAAPLGMPPTYFSRFFKQAARRGFVEFVTRLRISKSCELLARSELPVTEVCFESGFSNLSNFTRRFQQ